MSLLKRILPGILLLLTFSMVQAQEDTVLYQRDSVIEAEDPTIHFFQTGEKIANPAKTLLVTKTNKTISLSSLLKAKEMTYPEHTLADLDNDGKKELVISNFTGGAHCCDEIYIYKNIAPNKFHYVVKMFGGHTIVTPKRTFKFSFDESFGYFFTCYGCGYADTSDAAPIPLRSVTLRYSKGKIAIVPGDKELRSTINDNLEKLAELPFEKLDAELAMDDGLRKEFAMNLAVFYYSFGRNISETKMMFNKYYRYPDAAKVWTAFSKNLLYIKKDSDF